MSFSISIAPCTVQVFAASNDVTIQSVKDTPTKDWYNEEIEEECQERIDSVVKKVIAARQPNGEPLTTELKLKYIHDWIILSTKYDHESLVKYCEKGDYSTNGYIYEKYGPIVYGMAVCSGFSEAFKAIVDELVRQSGAKIECEIAMTENRTHAWNRVKFNGKWYLIDTTGDKNNNNVKFSEDTWSEYFLISDYQYGVENYKVARSSTDHGSTPEEKATDRKYEWKEWPSYKKDISEYTVDFENPNEVYTDKDGSYIPPITVRHGLNVLPPEDYSVERIDKPEAGATAEIGTAKIKISSSVYRIDGSITKTIPVEISGTAKSSDEYELDESNGTRPFDKEFKPFASTYAYIELSTLEAIKDKSLVLKKGTDYTVSYKDNQKKGWATATITMKGKYAGEVTVKYQITAEKPKTGGKISGTAKSSKQYGFNGSNSVCPFSKEFKPFDTVYKYDKRSTDLKKDKSLTLKKGTDYTVSYKNNKKPGWATATITMKGAYSGKVTVKYQIVKDKLSGAAKSTKQYKLGKSKKAIKPFDKTFQPFVDTYTYSKRSTTLKTNQSLTLKKGKDYTVSYKNNKKKGWATATITLKGKYTGKVTVKYKIT